MYRCIPGPSKGCQLNSKKLENWYPLGTIWHPFRVQNRKFNSLRIPPELPGCDVKFPYGHEHLSEASKTKLVTWPYLNEKKTYQRKDAQMLHVGNNKDTTCLVTKVMFE